MVSLAHDNQLPLPRLQSASGRESDSCKKHNSKYLTLTFTFISMVLQCKLAEGCGKGATLSYGRYGPGRILHTC